MVCYAQQTGWIYEQYLEEGGVPVGYMTTTTALNLRTQPSTRAAVIIVMPPNTAVRWTDEVANGFRRVNFQGTNGWAYDQYLKQQSGRAPPIGGALPSVATEPELPR